MNAIKDRFNGVGSKNPPFKVLDAELLSIERKVSRLQIYPSEYPRPSVKELEKRIKVVSLPGGKGHYWEMDPELIQELYPTGWLHKVQVSKEAVLGKPQLVLILGAQTAKRDFLESAEWVSEHMGEQERKIMKANLTIYCIDVLGPSSDSKIWKLTQRNGHTVTTLNSNFAQGIYETSSIEDFLSKLTNDLDYKKRFAGKDLHIVAEGSTDYLSEETLSDLLVFASSGEVKSLTLRTIIPTSSDQYVTPDTVPVINDSLKRDLGIKINNTDNLVNQTNSPLPANDIKEVVQNAWKTNYSDEQHRQKGLDSTCPGNHLRPQDLISTFRLLGRKVRYNLFSTIGGYPDGVSIVIY
ncbi:MAG: hypothetical protein ACD_57C00155G0001 [uncultured bacterium]|nr:MAG: hypothetical protein ACD_57C00155G0001 [uncultured bacterium]